MTDTSYTEMADVLEHLHLLVREARRARGLSIRAAARQVGVPYVNFHRIETGQGSSTSTLIPVLRWLDRSPEDDPTLEA